MSTLRLGKAPAGLREKCRNSGILIPRIQGFTRSSRGADRPDGRPNPGGRGEASKCRDTRVGPFSPRAGIRGDNSTQGLRPVRFLEGMTETHRACLRGFAREFGPFAVDVYKSWPGGGRRWGRAQFHRGERPRANHRAASCPTPPAHGPQWAGTHRAECGSRRWDQVGAFRKGTPCRSRGEIMGGPVSRQSIARSESFHKMVRSSWGE